MQVPGTYLDAQLTSWITFFTFRTADDETTKLFVMIFQYIIVISFVFYFPFLLPGKQKIV
jgi:hypothetical protein